MRSRRLLLVVALALLGAIGASDSAAAHAEYQSSTPVANTILPFSSAPTAVSISFSEAVQPGTARIRVTNASGATVSQPAVSLSADGRTISGSLGSIGSGVYTVAWSVTSAVDGHFTAGSFAFAIQNPDGSLPGPLPDTGPTSQGPPVSPVEVAFRFLAFGGLALAFGGTVLARFVWLPASRDPDARDPQAYGVTLRIVLHWARVGALVYALALGGLWIQTTGLEAGGGGGSILGSPFLLSLAARIGVGGALFLVLSGAFVRYRDAPPEILRRPLEMSLLLAMGAIVAGSFGTHAAAGRTGSTEPFGPWTYTILGMSADAGHVAGVAYWVGGLAMLVAVRSFLRADPALPLARYVFAGFSRFAAYAVGLVIYGGAVLAVLLVGSLDRLVSTGYGWVVLAKISLFAPMLAFGAYNRFRLVPRTAEPEGIEGAVRRLGRNVRVETVIGISVLAVAALLTSMTPAISVAAGPQAFGLEATVEDLRLRFEVWPHPSVPGVYTFSVFVYNATTGAAYNAARPDSGTLLFTLNGSTLPPSTANLSGPHGNHFFVDSPAMSQPGTWRIDVRFARADGFDIRATFHVTIRGGG